MNDVHIIATLAEWDEFLFYDWKKVFKKMLNPAFIFDGRYILNSVKMNETGFKFKGIGKG